jgi:hypothetical protein
MPRGVPNKPKSVCIKMRYRTHINDVMVDPQQVLEVDPAVAAHLIQAGYAQAWVADVPPESQELDVDEETGALVAPDPED